MHEASKIHILYPYPPDPTATSEGFRFPTLTRQRQVNALQTLFFIEHRRALFDERAQRGCFSWERGTTAEKIRRLGNLDNNKNFRAEPFHHFHWIRKEGLAMQAQHGLLADKAVHSPRWAHLRIQVPAVGRRY